MPRISEAPYGEVVSRKRPGDRHARTEGEARRRAHAGRTQRATARPEPSQSSELEADLLEHLGEPDLFATIDEALNAAHPAALLMLASGIAAATEPDPDRIPEDGEEDDDAPDVSLDLLLSSFRDVARRQTDALLLVMKEFLPDPQERDRIRREIAARRHPLPGWLLRLERLVPKRAVAFTDVLDDGDDVVVEIELPTRRTMTLIVYVDTNLGTAVKNAFLVEASLEAVLAIHEENAEEGMSVVPLSLADARARIAQGVENGRMLYPPIESDEWPGLRPFVEWILRLMPEGGTAIEWVEPSESDLEHYRDAFLSSQYASGLAEHGIDIGGPSSTAAGIADNLMWFASSHGTGDPLRFSPTSLEILLTEWVPRKIMADDAYLRAVPEVARRFVRFAHERRDVPPSRTAEAISSIDQFEPEYLAIISKPRRHGPLALMERLGMLPPLGDDTDLDSEGHTAGDLAALLARMAQEPGIDQQLLATMRAKAASMDPSVLDTPSWLLARLAKTVGGASALDELDTVPLPAEQLMLDGVPSDVRERVASLAGLLDPVAEAWGGPELVTSARRILARIASGDPGIFRRRSKDENTAAAVLWISIKVNDLLGHGSAGELAEAFGLTSVPTQRAQPMLSALGVPDQDRAWWAYESVLGDPALLTSERRLGLVVERDRLREWQQRGTP